MFIPKGKAIHENLATSYVLVDALVADLCEGGFTGVVEVVLRDTDSHVIISRGNVTATVETRLNGEGANNSPSSPHRPAVAELAARAKLERGRVSVYSYSLATATAITGRLTSQPLYTGLSTEFADLEKMISKLGRERDRQWFIEIDSASGVTGLIHLSGERCWVMTSDAGRPEAEADGVDLMQNSELRGLVDDFNSAGGTFDVFFRSPTNSTAEFSGAAASESQWIEPPGLKRAGVGASPLAKQGGEEPASTDEVAQAMMTAKAAFASIDSEDAHLTLIEEAEAGVESPPDPVPPSPTELEEARLAVLGLARESEVEEKLASDEAPGKDSPGDTRSVPIESAPSDAKVPDDHASNLEEDELSLVSDDFKASIEAQRASEAEVMAEVKRLMGEVTRSIEEAIQSVEQRSTFPIHLRAGQLKVADRYPFLDPFGTEFEYLAGEIAFVGQASPAEFVDGLTEALKIAVDGVAQTSAQPSRVRGRVSEALRSLLSRQQTEFEAYGLDESINEILDS
jgi:hypothetical protein